MAVFDLEVAPDYAVDGWHSLDSARYGWTDAPWQDSILSDLLEVAKEQCLAYAPTQPTVDGVLDGGDAETDFSIPVRFRVAQLMQARNVWNAAKVDPSSGGFGDGSYVIQPKPLDWHVKNLLRPKRAVPGVW